MLPCIGTPETNISRSLYIKELEDYLVDHFPFRDMFMNIHLTSERILLKDEISDVYFAQDVYLIEKYNKPVNTKKIINRLNKFYEKLNYVNMNLMLVPTSVQINKDLLPSNSLSFTSITSPLRILITSNCLSDE